MLFPVKIDIAFNVRYSTETNADEIKQRIINVIESKVSKYDIKWNTFWRAIFDN